MLGRIRIADLSAFSNLEEYRQRASNPDLSAMSGRDGHQDVTEFVSQSILTVLQPSDGLLVDIGCGDGTLLSMLPDGVQGIGILPTENEVARLRRDGGGLNIRLGTAHKTRLPDAYADYLVANAVLQLAPPLHLALAELRRVVKSTGRIYIGELPRCNERKPRQRLWILRQIASNLRHRGPVAAIKAAIWVLSSVVSGSVRSNVLKDHIFIEPDEFTALAAKYGLRVIWSAEDKRFPIRINYLLDCYCGAPNG